MPDVYSGEVDSLSVTEIEGPIQQEGKRSEWISLMSDYGTAAEQAEREGRNQDALVLRFLQALFSLNPTFDTPEAPFGPMWVIDGRRSIIPDDLSDADLEAIQVLANRAKHPFLRARLNDLLWIRRKDHRACIAAATAYLEAAEIAVSAKIAHKYKRNYKRALQLAGRLGRESALYKQVVKSLEAALDKLLPTEAGFASLHLMELLLSGKVGDPKAHAAQAGTLADQFSNAGDYYKSRTYLEMKASWLHRAGEEESSKIARRDAAEILVIEAEQRVSLPGNFLAGSSLLAEAIEGLRRAGADRHRIEELKRRLADYQEKSMSEMGRISGEVDISEAVIQARGRIRGLPLHEAIRKLAFGHGTTKVEALRAEVEESAKKFVFTHLLGNVLVDHKGRPIANQRPIHGAQGEMRDESIESAMFHHASQFHWSMRAIAYIEPSRLELLNDHHPTYDDLSYLVHNNPFVPPDHEGIFLRGLYAGFHGDFLLASHFLVPQIENSIRYLLESRGVDVTNLMSDRTQPVKILGALLSLDDALTMFGESLIFELRGLLNEKTGYDLRNRIAHGFVDTDEGQGLAAINAWWLTLRLCEMSYLMTKQKGPTTQPGPEGEPTVVS